jgi:hypothetical protein
VSVEQLALEAAAYRVLTVWLHDRTGSVLVAASASRSRAPPSLAMNRHE